MKIEPILENSMLYKDEKGRVIIPTHNIRIGIWSRCYYCNKVYWVEDNNAHFCDNECKEASENEIGFISKPRNIPIIKGNKK